VAPNDHQTANFVIMEEEPIIAWAIVPNLGLNGGPASLPITYSAAVMDTGKRKWIVRRPDGMVDAGRGWESEEDCFEETLPDMYDLREVITVTKKPPPTLTVVIDVDPKLPTQ
jgi:hypothetical protein